MAAGQGRLFTRDPEDRTLLHYSKIRLDGDAVNGNDALTLRTPQEGGDATGVVVTEGALLLFAKYAAYIAVGQGLSNTGGPPDYAAPQRNADVGCIDPRSVVKSPAGVFFQSKKGMYRMGANGGQLDFVGVAIEDDLSGTHTVVGAIHIPTKHQVRFYSTNGIMVYDYLAGAWSKWTPGGTYKHAVLWGDVAVYVDGTAPRRQFIAGDGNTWLDAGTIYSMDVETGSIKFGGIAGRMKVRRLTVTGKIQGAHKLRIRTTRDDQTTADDVSYTLSSGGGVRRLRVGCAFPARMAPMRVRITDEGDGVVTLASSFDISGLSLNVGVAKGLNISGAQDRK